MTIAIGCQPAEVSRMCRTAQRKTAKSRWFSPHSSCRRRYNQASDFPAVRSCAASTHERGKVVRPLVTLADCLASGACLLLKTRKGRPWFPHKERSPLPCSQRRCPAHSARIAASDRTRHLAYTRSARSRTRRRKWRRSRRNSRSCGGIREHSRASGHWPEVWRLRLQRLATLATAK